VSPVIKQSISLGLPHTIRTMTQIASPVAIQADFDGRELKMGQTTYKLFMQGDQYWVRTPHPKWEIDQDPLKIRKHPNPPMSE